MFDFLGRREPDRRASLDRRRARGPFTIGFEQLEGREMLSSGVSLTVIPSGLPPLRSMPRPLVGSINPEAGAEVVTDSARRSGPIRRSSGFWSLSERFRRR